MAGESRGHMENRLQREGRWEAFEARRRELKADGMTGSEAYQQAVTEFAEPLSRTDGAPELVPKGTFKGKRAPGRKAVEWVAEHVGIADVEPQDAPSGEAWSLLAWASSDASNTADFWKVVYPKILPTKSQIDAEDTMRGDDGRDLHDLIDRVRREHGGPLCSECRQKFSGKCPDCERELSEKEHGG